MSLRVPTLAAAALLLLAGCFPGSCRREASRALTPADSLSRALAATVPVDTLRMAWGLSAAEAERLEYPRTVGFGREGRLYVGDAGRDAVLVFTPEGAFAEAVEGPFAVPYLAGFRGDTLFVFSPEANRLDAVVGGEVVRTLPTPTTDLPPRGRLVYAAAGPEGFFVKVAGDDHATRVFRLDAAGRVRGVDTLAGPSWRHAGLLRAWGDTLVSLSGYRPVVDLVQPGRPPDTLALRGFDSPMLARSRRFLLGEVDRPPLLTASAQAVGDRLFVLNLRPGWLRVDVYDRGGRLERVLVQDAPAYDRTLYPVDLAVRAVQGGYEIAALAVEPRPQMALFRWMETPPQTPPGPRPTPAQ